MYNKGCKHESVEAQEQYRTAYRNRKVTAENTSMIRVYVEIHTRIYTTEELVYCKVS